jgi:hypothetical protein
VTAILKWMMDLAAGLLVKWLAKYPDNARFKWCCDCGSFELCDGQVTVMKCRCEE